jgi:hypothetical protein
MNFILPKGAFLSKDIIVKFWGASYDGSEDVMNPLLHSVIFYVNKFFLKHSQLCIYLQMLYNIAFLLFFHFLKKKKKIR